MTNIKCYYLKEHPLCEIDRGNNNWTPYRDHVQFKVAELYCCNQMSAGDINFIMGLQAVSLVPHNDSLPFENVKDMHNTIDSAPLGNIPWQSFTLNYDGPPPKILGPDGNAPPWMTADYNIWFHDPSLLV